MWDKVAELFVIAEESTDDAGYTVETGKYRQVFVNELSIGQNEFYKAKSAGFKAEIKLEVNEIDYNNESIVRYEGMEYKVIRTYSKGEVIEVTLEGDLSGVSTKQCKD